MQDGGRNVGQEKTGGRWRLCGVLLALAVFNRQASARDWIRVAEKAVAEIGNRSTTVQHQGAIEVGFSPDEGAERLVLRVIDSARSEIRLMAYSFTSVPVTKALLAARKRGVDVALVVDAKSNAGEDRSGKARAALSALVNAGCRVRTISTYQIHHDKVLVVDNETVETGSFNFSAAAADRNSENVIVIWKNPDLAKGYLRHWADRFAQGQDYSTRY